MSSVVKNGKLYTPKVQYVLAGVSRQTVVELAEQLGLTLGGRRPGSL